MYLPRFPRFLLRSIFRIVLVLIFLGIPASLAYLSVAGLPPAFTRHLADALGGSRAQVEIDRVTFGLFSGLSAERVRVASAEGQPLASLNRLRISLNLSALSEGRLAVDAVEFGGANLIVPDFHGSRLEFQEVNARIVTVPGLARVSRCDFVFEGVRFDIQGDFLRPEEFLPSRRDEATADDETSKPPQEKDGTLHSALEILREIRFERMPVVRAVLRGDPASSPPITADAFQIESGALDWRNARLMSVRVSGSARDGQIVLDSMEIADPGGRLLVAGSYSMETKVAEFQTTGSLNPLPWLDAVGSSSPISELGLSSSPQIETAGTADFSTSPPNLRLGGEVSLADAEFRGVPITQIHAPFAWKPGAFLTRNASLKSPAVNATFDAIVEDGIAKLRAEGQATPTRCLPWLDAGMQKVFGAMEFAVPGRGNVELEWPLSNSGALRGVGEIALGRSAMHGSWIDSATAKLRIEDRAVTYEELDVRAGDGRGSGTFVYDFGRKQVRLSDIKSSLDPYKIMLWIDKGIAETLRQYRFRGPPAIKADGVVDMGTPTATKLDFGVRAPTGMEYDLLGKTLVFDSVEGNLGIRGSKLRADVTDARIFSGKVTMTADVSIDPKNRVYSLGIAVENVNFADLTRLYFDYTDSEGKMSLLFDYTAGMDDQTLLEGKGNIRVERGNVFAIPIFGPLSGILSSIIPGSGHHTARLATADFTVGQRKISTENLEIAGQGFSLFGQGDLFFVEDRMDMSVRINARGVTGVLLLPFSKLFEYVSTGSAKHPVWRPKNVPRELFDLLPGTDPQVPAPVAPAEPAQSIQPTQAEKRIPSSPPTPRRRNLR